MRRSHMPACRTTPLYLASRSPRRVELLRLLEVDFEQLDVEVDEAVAAGEPPAAYVERVAHAKADAALPRVPPGSAVLAADTSVSVDGRILGKPGSAADAAAMLRALSGRWHDVHTAIVVHAPAGRALRVVATRVEFAVLDDATIACYWRTGEPRDKAGGYGIQGLGGALVKRIEGSWSAVVGLPLNETLELLTLAGVAHTLRG